MHIEHDLGARDRTIAFRAVFVEKRNDSHARLLHLAEHAAAPFIQAANEKNIYILANVVGNTRKARVMAKRQQGRARNAQSGKHGAIFLGIIPHHISAKERSIAPHPGFVAQRQLFQIIQDGIGGQRQRVMQQDMRPQHDMAGARAHFRRHLRAMAKFLQAMADGIRHFPKAFGMGVIGRRHDQDGKFHVHLVP